MTREDRLEILAMVINILSDRPWKWEEDVIEAKAMDRLESVLNDAYQAMKEV